MLQQILTLMQQSNGVPLSTETISRQLGLSPDVVAQMLRTLVQRGRLLEVDEACTGCTICPLKVVCAGAPAIPQHGYMLVDSP